MSDSYIYGCAEKKVCYFPRTHIMPTSGRPQVTLASWLWDIVIIALNPLWRWYSFNCNTIILLLLRTGFSVGPLVYKSHCVTKIGRPACQADVRIHPFGRLGAITVATATIFARFFERAPCQLACDLWSFSMHKKFIFGPMRVVFPPTIPRPPLKFKPC